MPDARLIQVAGGLALQSDYSGELVSAIKALPYSDRRWDKPSRSWIIAPEHADQVARLVEMHLGVTIEVPAAAPVSTVPEIRMAKMEYLGRCKARGAFGTGDSTASGYADGGWSLQFPEQVLREWFAAGEQDQPEELKTLYQVLGVKSDVDPADLKKAYRRLALHTHPDHNREPDANEQFKKIQHAYEMLRDDRLRRKYNAGLLLEQRTKEQEVNSHPHRYAVYDFNFRAPLRCGLLLVEGSLRVGVFTVSTIHKWEDITDSQGRTMVSSWKLGADSFSVEWV